MIVDDERLARKQLRDRLAAHPDIAVVAEADGVVPALAAAQKFEPDLVFLDIQMPGLSGFDFLERAANSFKTIFVTAYDEFALRAFEVNALDYLLKPVQADRLARTVRRLQPLDSRLCETQRQQTIGFDYSDNLFVSTARKARFIPLKTIYAIQSAGAYSEIYASDGTRWMMLRGLREWQIRLPASHFVRIHRSTIVNLDFIERVEPLHNYTYNIFLRGCAGPLVMSRRSALLLKARLG